MRPRISKKLAAGAVASAAVLGISGAAFAYFQTTGNGSGSASVGTSSNFVVTSDAATGGPLTPVPTIGSGPIEAVAFHVNNPSTGQQYLHTATVSVAKSDGTAWTSQTDNTKPACTAADFSVQGEAVGTAHVFTFNNNMAASATQDGSVTLQLVDNHAIQDNCKGVTVPLYISAS